jgi:sulfite reductase (ferredoxin)
MSGQEHAASGQEHADFNNRYANLGDVDEFVLRTQDYAAGLLATDEYRAYRLTRGVYGQRQDNVFMLRIKMPGGIVMPDQLRRVADVIDVAPERLGHITTRENIQIHYFPLDQVADKMRMLAEAGLTMTEACGNAVRNVTQDPLAGLAQDEVFDTTPYLQAIVRFFMRNERAQKLPRKFKIALSSSPADRGYAAIHDVGLVAVKGPDGAPAFKMLVAGGLASMPRSGLCVHEAWPAKDILTPMLAVIDFFQAHGNRKVRSKARIKHVLRKMGDAQFLATYKEFLAKVQVDPPAKLDHIDTLYPGIATWKYARPNDAAVGLPGFKAWADTCVRETRLQDQVFVTVRLDRGGEVTAQNLRDLATLTETYGEGKLHFTPQQNAVLRAVPVTELHALFHQLQVMDLAKAGADTIADITSCPGVSTCNLGVTYSRNLADELVDLVSGMPETDATIKISGCHNSCGQHHIGTIGLYGALRRIGGRPAPHYRLMVGGDVNANGAVFGDDLGLVPAGRATTAVQRLLDHATQTKQPGESVGGFLRRVDKETLKPVVADLLDIADDAAQELDFWDIKAPTPFLGETREGECAV